MTGTLDESEVLVIVKQLVMASRLLRRAVPHVYRQVNHGRHEQDRADAEELLPALNQFLKTIGD